MKTVCGIDLGTQSCKIILYDYENRKTVARASSPLEMIAENDGTREQEAGWYEKAMADCFHKIDSNLLAAAVAVGVSGQQHGFVPLDENGKALYRVKLWCDTSTAEECDEITGAFGGEAALIAETGLPQRAGYTAPKVLWLKKHRPELFARLRHILLPHDYLNFLLTGNCAAEYGDASGTALFDIRKRAWSEKVCAVIDPEIIGCLPETVAPWEASGFVSSEAAKKYGLPEGIPVSAGGGDNMMGAIGTGTVREGFLTMSLGTSGTLYGFSPVPVVDPSGDLAAFCSSTGGWLPLLCTMNCTVASEEFRRVFGMGLNEFDAAAERAPAGAEGIAVLPYFNGERTPNLPAARASVNGMTAANFSRENLCRAALESAIFGMRLGLEGFSRLGFSAKEIRLSGGGAKSPLWRNIAANVMKLPVRVPSGEESAATGAALQALWCAERLAGKNTAIEEIADTHVALEGETVEPGDSETKRYDAAFAEWSRYLSALSPLYGQEH